jgi:hypothetical protein
MYPMGTCVAWLLHSFGCSMKVAPLLFAASCAASFPAAISPAADAEAPAQYRGLWCDGSKGYYRCRKATSEAYLHIRRDRINLSEEGDCRITAVTPIAKGHRLRVYCPPNVHPDPPEHVNLRLDARGRLHFRPLYRPSIGAAISPVICAKEKSQSAMPA